MNVLLLLRGEALRCGDGRNPLKPVDTTAQDQAAALASHQAHIVAPLTDSGHNVNVVADIVCPEHCAKTVARQLASAFGPRLIAMHLRPLPEPTQNKTVQSVMERQRRRAAKYDTLLLSRMDVLWTRSPLPAVLPSESIMVLFDNVVTPKGRPRFVCDVFFAVPRQCLQAFDAYIQRSTKTFHDIRATLPDRVSTLCPHDYASNTAVGPNPFYVLIGRHRATDAEDRCYRRAAGSNGLHEPVTPCALPYP